MARWTQYIGLSAEAVAFLAENNAKEVGSYKMTQGIGYENVMGRLYEIEHPNDSPPFDWNETYAEIEDVTPWSSGPRIYTALRNIRTGEVLFKWNKKDIHWD